MKSNLSKIGVYFATSIINAFISLLSSVILTRIFTTEIYGTLNLFNSASSLFMGIFCFGFDSSYLRFFYDRPNKDSEQDFFRNCFFFPAITFIVFAIIINLFLRSLFSDKIIGIQNEIITLLFCLNVFAQIILRFLNLNYRLRGKTKSYALQSVATQLFLKIFVITSTFVSLKIPIILGFNSIGIFILSIIYILIQFESVLKTQNRLSFNNYGKIVKFAIFSSPSYIILYLNTFLTQRIIVHNLGISALGIYSAASLFIFALTVFSSGFTTFWGPYFYKNYKEKQEFISKVHDIVLLFTIIFFILLLSFSDIVYLFIGEKFRHDKEIIGFLLIYPILAMLSETTVYGINVANKNYISLLTNLLHMLINSILAYILSKKFGLLGIAISSSISAIIMFAINTFFGQKFYKTIQHPASSILNVLIIFTIAITYYFFCNKKTYFFVVCVLLVGVVYVLNIYTFKFIFVCIKNLSKNRGKQ